MQVVTPHPNTPTKPFSMFVQTESNDMRVKGTQAAKDGSKTASSHQKEKIPQNKNTNSCRLFSMFAVPYISQPCYSGAYLEDQIIDSSRSKRRL